MGPGRSKILVIDDEDDFCEFVKWSLEKTGKYEVVVSTDGAAGIALAEAEQPVLILLDIRMPQMNGAEVADHLLHSDSTRDIPIAFITGLLQKDEVKKRSGYIHRLPIHNEARHEGRAYTAGRIGPRDHKDTENLHRVAGGIAGLKGKAGPRLPCDLSSKKTSRMEEGYGDTRGLFGELT